MKPECSFIFLISSQTFKLINIMPCPINIVVYYMQFQNTIYFGAENKNLIINEL